MTNATNVVSKESKEIRALLEELHAYDAEIDGNKFERAICCWHLGEKSSYTQSLIEEEIKATNLDFQSSGQNILKEAKALDFYMNLFGMDSDQLRVHTDGIFWSGMYKVMARIARCKDQDKARTATMSLKGHKAREYGKVLDSLKVPQARKRQPGQAKYSIDAISEGLKAVGLNSKQIETALLKIADAATPDA